MAMVLAEVGQVAAAQRSGADGLARARQAGDLSDQAFLLLVLADLDLMAGRIPEAGAHLREVLEIAARTGDRFRLIDVLDLCGHICAATGRHAEAITLWADAGPAGKNTGYPTCRTWCGVVRDRCGRPRTRWDRPGRGRPGNAAPP